MGTDEVYKQIKSIETGDYVVFAQTLVRLRKNISGCFSEIN